MQLSFFFFFQFNSFLSEKVTIVTQNEFLSPLENTHAPFLKWTSNYLCTSSNIATTPVSKPAVMNQIVFYTKHLQVVRNFSVYFSVHTGIRSLSASLPDRLLNIQLEHNFVLSAPLTFVITTGSTKIRVWRILNKFPEVSAKLPEIPLEMYSNTINTELYF